MSAKDLISRWTSGRASVGEQGQISLARREQPGLVQKLRAAYRWIAEQSLRPGALDMEWDVRERVSSNGLVVDLPKGESLSSFVLLPLLTLITSRRMVFVGAPGHGKTSMATIMGLLAGSSLDEVRRAVQHGHPQLTIADLLGSPLPGDLVGARSMDDIRIAWRDWIGMRVKIIDEYNRIPTKTQSALLSLMAEGYAEMYEQTVDAGQSAWFLTANDDLGGGTFPVIEALRDRIDIVVRCAPFHSRYLNVLSERIASDTSPERHVPDDIVFSAADFSEADQRIREITVPQDVVDVLGFFLSQLDFCRRASDSIQSMNKDTLHLTGRRVAHVCTEDCPLDKHINLCSQTESGVSPRTYQSILHYSRALAFFHGRDEVLVDDVRQLIPWLLFEKLKVNPQSQFFQNNDNKVFLTDRAAWIRNLFDVALQQHASYQPVRRPILEMESALAGAEGLSTSDLERFVRDISKQIAQLLDRHELNGPVHEDLVRLKMLHAQCQKVLSLR